MLEIFAAGEVTILSLYDPYTPIPLGDPYTPIPHSLGENMDMYIIFDMGEETVTL